MYVVFLYDLSWSAFVVYFIVRMCETDQFGIERRFNSAVNVPSVCLASPCVFFSYNSVSNNYAPTLRAILCACVRIFDVYGLI